MAREVLRELYILLGFQGDTKDAKEFESSLDSVLTAVKGFVAFKAAEKIGRELAGIATGIADQAVALKQSADALGYTTDQLQELQYAAGTANIPVETIVSSLESLRQLQAQQMTGDGGAVGLFGAIGAPGEDAVETLARMADRLAALPPHMQRLAAQKAGMTELMPLLRLGGEYIRDMAAEARDLGIAFGEDLVEKGNLLNSQLFKLNTRMEILKKRAAEDLIPIGLELAGVLLRLWDRFGKLLTMENLRKVLDRLVATLEALAIAIAAVGAAAAVLAIFTQWDFLVVALVTRLIRLIEVWKLFQASMLSSALLWGLLAAGIVLVIDDLYALTTGGKSFLGWLYTTNPVLRKFTDFWGDLHQAMEDALDTMQRLFPALSPLIEGMKSLLGMRDDSTNAALGKINKQLEDAQEERDKADMNDDKAGMARASRRIAQLKGQRAELIREEALSRAGGAAAATTVITEGGRSVVVNGGATTVNQSFAGPVSPGQAGAAAGAAVSDASARALRQTATGYRGSMQ